MKNSKNKVIASIVCGLIIGSVGTSYVGNFQSQQTNIESLKGKPQEMIPDGRTKEKFEGKRPGNHQEGVGSLQTNESVDVSSGKYSDGTYEGEASGYGPNLKVQVTVSSGKISDIEIVSHNETPGFYERAFETVPSDIIQKQSTDVDTVSGATYSSVGIINAVTDALKGVSTTENSSKENTNTQSNLDTSAE